MFKTILFLLPFVLYSICSKAIAEKSFWSKQVRSCDGYYKVVVSNFTNGHYSNSVNIFSLPIAKFKSFSNCFYENYPFCLDDLKNYSLDCMDAHWKQRDINKVPVECEVPGIFNYRPEHLSDYIQEEVCDQLRFFGGNISPSALITVYTVTSGEKNCRAKEKLVENFEVTCSENRLRNNPLTINEVESGREVNISNSDLNIKRYVKVAKKCSKQGECNVDVSIFMDRRDVENNKIFGVDNIPGDDIYKGCGIKVSQNVLRFFGIQLGQDEILEDVPRHLLYYFDKEGQFKVSYATLIEELRDGLQKILDKHGMSHIEVVSYTGKQREDIVEFLQEGFPVIANIDKGIHWVTITGYKGSKFRQELKYGSFFMQDMWENQVRPWRRVDLEYAPSESFFRVIPNTLGRIFFKSGSVIAFRKKSST